MESSQNSSRMINRASVSRPPGRSPPTEFELQESTVSLLRTELDLTKKERDTYKLQVEKFKNMMQTDDEDSLISPRITRRNYHDYDFIKAECERAMSELAILKGQYADVVNNLKSATKECDYHRNRHQTALQTTNQLQNEMYDLRSRLIALMAEKDQLEQEARNTQRNSDMDRRELLELRQLYRSQRMYDPEGRMERLASEDRDHLQADFDVLNNKYLENLSDLSTALKRAESSDKEHLRLKKVAEEAIKDKNVAISELEDFKRQISSIQTRWESSSREQKKTVEHLNKLQEKSDRALVDLSHERSLRQRISRDLARVTDERNVAQTEYKLVMSERDTVLRETQKVQDELTAAREKISTMENEKKSVHMDLESLQREISSALHDRDQALKDSHELKERLANAEDEPQRASEAEKFKTEMTHMQQLVENLKQEIGDAQREITVIQGQRAFVYKKRDEAVLEKESMRKLCDNVRRERDKAVRDLSEALRENDGIKRQCVIVSNECQELRDKLERRSNRENRPRQLHSGRYSESRDSAIDTDFTSDILSETLEVDLDLEINPSMLGFDLSGGSDDPTCPTNLFVSHVMKGSPAEGKLQVSDFLLRVNDIDLAHADRETAFQALHSSSGTVNLLIRRRKMVKMCSKSIPFFINIPPLTDLGLSLSQGLYVSRLSPSSPLIDAGICVGDRITHLSGESLDERTPEDVHRVLKSYENHTVALSVVRYYASSPILNNSFDSSDSGKGHVQPFPYPNPRSPVSRHRMVNADVQTDVELERNDSTLRQKRLSESGGKGSRKSIFDVFPIEVKSQSVTKTTKSSSSGKEQRGTMKFLDRLLRRDKKPDSRPIIKVIPNISDETRVIQEFVSVIEQHQSKHGTRSYTISKTENMPSGTWPKYRGAPLELLDASNDQSLRLSPKRVDRKSVRSLTISSRQVPWMYTDIPLDETLVPSPTPSTNTLKAQRNKVHRLSGPPSSREAVYDTVRSPVPIPEPIYPNLQRKTSANVDTSDSSSMSSSLDFTDGRRFPRNEARPLQGLNKRPYLESSPPTIDAKSEDPMTRVTMKSSAIATNGTLRSRDILRSDPCSPLSLPRDENRHYGPSYTGSICNDPSLLKRPVTLGLPTSGFWQSGESFSNIPGSGRLYLPSGSYEFSKYSTDRLSTGSITRMGHSSPVLVASPLDRNAPPLYQTIKRRPQIGQVRTVRVDCYSDNSGNPGFRIGSHSGGIYIFSVMENSIADKVGLVVGDQVLDVCGINLRSATYDAAVKVFKSAGSVLVLQVQYQGPLPVSSVGSTSSFQSPLSSSVATSSDSVGPNGTLKSSQQRAFDNVEQRRESLQRENRDARFVKLTKGLTDPPGINLIGGNVYGIFIHFVQPDTAAAKCNQLSCGDQILEYNGINMRSLLLEKAMFELCKPLTNVSMVVRYNPEKFEMAKCSPGDSLFVKTLWDRDKSNLQDEELMFHKGDILFVDNTLYNGEIGSWRAWLLSENAETVECGIIPNRYKAEEECLGLQQSNFDLADSLDPNRRPSARRSLFKRRKVKRAGTELASFSDSSLGTDTFSVAPIEPNIPTYLRVDKVVYEEMRPVLILGPLSDIIIDRLLQTYPERFARCPVNTSNEAPVVDDPDVVEIRPASGVWETLSLKSIREIMEKNLHCFVDINITSIERLQSFNINPIVLLISFRSSSAIREVRDPVFNSSKLSHKAAKELFESALRIESEHGKLITASVAGGTSLPCTVKLVASAIESAQIKPEWVSLGPVT